MKNNEVSLFKSFRFKIVFYTFLSLIYTAITEGVLYLLLKGIHSIIVKNPPIPAVTEQSDILSNQFANSILAPKIQKQLQNNDPFTGFVIAFMVLFGVICFILFFLFLTKKFSVYLHEIVTGINKMATGDLTTRIFINDEDEFAIIGRRLNAMAGDIRILMENERKSEQMKNDLITNVAHDLRTPLTSIIGYLDLTIREPELQEETRCKYIQVAYDKSIRLEKLIGDLFNYTKFSSSEMKLNLISIDIVKLMEQMVDEFYPSFQEANLQCEFTSDKENAMVIADGDMLARAFSNLIGNAVKYGRDGKNIRICISQNSFNVIISITNYGEIIPKENIGFVFDRFYRVESSRNFETGGTGLGLAIAKKVIMQIGRAHV